MVWRPQSSKRIAKPFLRLRLSLIHIYNRNNRNQGRPQPEGPIKIQTISAENRKQETEPLREQKENKACEEVGREKKQEERRGPEPAKEGAPKLSLIHI